MDISAVGSLDGANATPAHLATLAADLRQRLVDQGLAVPPTVGLVRFPFGQSLSVGWSDLPTEADVESLLHRARRVELRTLIEVEEAVSTPTTYHYRLPSGHHSAMFVRVGDIFRHLRAGFVLSTWLRGALSPDGINIAVIDTGTISPIATELDVAARTVGAPRVQVLALDEYPESAYEFRRAFGSLRPPDGAAAPTVICILSVASTGGMRNRATHALDETAGSGSWRLEPLISRQSQEASGVPLDRSPGNHDPWLALSDLHSAPVSNASGCRLCQDPDRARIVSIDPRNFSAKSLPEPELLMPVVGDGRQNESLWNRYASIQPEGRGRVPPSISFCGRTRRNDDDRQADAGTYFEPSLLALDSLGATVAARLAELRSDDFPQLTTSTHAARERKAIVTAAHRLKAADLVVVDVEDVDAFRVAVNGGAGATDEAVCDLLSEGLAVVNPDGRRPHVVVVGGTGEERAASLVRAAEEQSWEPEPTILLFTSGLRLGVTLQRLLVDVHNAWRALGRDPVVNGLVLHAHPEDERAWAALRNAFQSRAGSTLLALWLTYVPHRSPLDEERGLLELAVGDATGAISEDINARLETLSSEGPDAGLVRPFWSAAEPRLRRTSYYGHELHDRVTLAAVGSAMQRARLINRPRNSPYWYRFDMPKIFRSYFDGLIHVAALRWLEPREGWWGASDGEQQLLVSEAKKQAPSDWPLVLAELLLASAQGKLPKSMSEVLVPEADHALDRPDDEVPEIAKRWIAVGRYLVKFDQKRGSEAG